MTLTVEFCGEQYPVSSDSMFTIGREGDLSVDDNPYLHRLFLTVTERDDLPMLSNVGNRLTASIADGSSAFHAFLGPGTALPIVFPRIVVNFTAGSTHYELAIENDDPSFRPQLLEATTTGETTLGPAKLTDDQKRLIVVLAADVLRGTARAGAGVPSSSAAAQTLGWSLTKFNRKLDNVCQKLARSGVSGLHGAPGELARGRRARLVDYAISTRLVDSADLQLIDGEGMR